LTNLSKKLSLNFCQTKDFAFEPIFLKMVLQQMMEAQVFLTIKKKNHFQIVFDDDHLYYKEHNRQKKEKEKGLRPSFYNPLFFFNPSYF
jgi:hypothetical protein